MISRSDCEERESSLETVLTVHAWDRWCTLRSSVRVRRAARRESTPALSGARHLLAQHGIDPATARTIHHDLLTGLPDEFLYIDRLGQALRDAARSRAGLAVLRLNLVRLNQINREQGSSAADAVIASVAGRLRDALRAGDTVARLSHDTFGVLLPGAHEPGALRVAHKLRIAAASPIEVGSQVISVDANIGVALYPEHGQDLAVLVEAAVDALEAARASGGGVVVHQTTGSSSTHDVRTLAGELRAAIPAGQLRLLYQPLIDCRERQIFRAEALVRWQHPTLGEIPPQRFIPLAEQTGAIDGITVWVLEEALKQCRQWQNDGHRLGVSVNIASQTLHDRQLPDLVDALLRYYRIEPSRLTLEVTERALMTDLEAALPVVTALAERGVRIALDDFGVGQSSLSALRDLPLHELKVDQSFVQQAHTDQGRALVAVILGLGATLGLQVVVEGVEDAATLEWLYQMNCPELQGFFVSRPLHAADFTLWLRDQQEFLPAT